MKLLFAQGALPKSKNSRLGKWIKSALNKLTHRNTHSSNIFASTTVSPLFLWSSQANKSVHRKITMTFNWGLCSFNHKKGIASVTNFQLSAFIYHTTKWFLDICHRPSPNYGDHWKTILMSLFWRFWGCFKTAQRPPPCILVWRGRRAEAALGFPWKLWSIFKLGINDLHYTVQDLLRELDVHSRRRQYVSRQSVDKEFPENRDFFFYFIVSSLLREKCKNGFVRIHDYRGQNGPLKGGQLSYFEVWGSFKKR